MSVKEKSFFSTVPGLVTGAAGLLTGVVGLLTVSTQLGWIGDDGDGGSTADQPAAESTATTARAGAARGTVAPSGGSGTTVASLSFQATPREITFGGLQGNEQRVTVRNTGNGPLPLRPITVTGANRDQFAIRDNECQSTLATGLSCTVTVTYLSTRVGESTANLVVQPANDSVRAQEVPLKGTRLI